MSDINYQTPKSNLMTDSIQSSPIGKWLAILGSVLLVSLPLGLVSTVSSMIQAFYDIKLNGAGDPTLMAGGISSALVSTVLGLVVALPGAVLLCVSIVFFKHRRPWVFRVSLIAALITLFIFPIGTVISVVILILLFSNKSSFYQGRGDALNKLMQDDR